jgi:hypothetical protein
MLDTNIRGRRVRDRMVVGFKTTYAIGAYHHWCCGFDSNPGQGVQHYVIKFVSDLRQVGGFPRVLWFPIVPYNQYKQKCEDTKGAIRSRNSKKDR